jgi:hypothetical protein
VQRYQLQRENHRLDQSERSRLQREQDDARRLLEQQRTMLAEFQAAAVSLTGKTSSKPPLLPNLPAELVAHYRELLRTYVIMGSGNLSRELARLAEFLVAARINATETMQLHLHVLGELAQGLGTRSTRHVMSRADLLALELLVHLAEGYRLRFQEYLQPPVQQLLPGFDQPPRSLFD